MTGTLKKVPTIGVRVHNSTSDESCGPDRDNPISNRQIYALLNARFGDLQWWPAESIDEVLIGAILTQNTSWKNVEKSILALKDADLLTIEHLSRVEESDLQKVIKSSGFYRQKARYLSAIAFKVVEKYGSLEAMRLRPLKELEIFLSSLPGIGRETMDSILLYALDKRTFVMDAYTSRIMGRLSGERLPGQDEIRKDVVGERSFDLSSLKNYHAMLVQLGKEYCRKNPLCQECPLRTICNYAMDLSSP